ncbi:unnamed protein product [Gemmataceae bacterium]|nr:unnamed protein product [Gemmataceae bacterium]VTT98955.1 unnamed protein product [Gemmataceae bacterium]
MTRTALVAVALALSAPAADAGPVRNLIERVREHRAERAAARSGTCRPFAAPAAAARSTCSACPAAAPHQRTAPADCPDGTCPLRRPVALAPAVVVFDAPRRMP